MNDLSIALVSPPFYQGPAWAEGEGPPFNIGIGYLAAYLGANGQRAEMLDLSCLRKEDPDALVERFGLDGYDLLGFSVYSQTMEVSIRIAAAAKAGNPGQLSVFGGPHVTAVGEPILRDFPEVDFTIRGEGEVPLLGLVECIRAGEPPADVGSAAYRENGRVVSNSILEALPPLDELPHPKRFALNGGNPFFTYYCELERRRKTAATISVSRGCPFACAFCIIQSVQRRYRTRSAGSVLDEVRQLYERSPFTHAWFTDADYLFRPDRALAIGRGLKAITPDFTWSCTARADQIIAHQDALPELMDSGLSNVEVGIESGSDTALKRWNKGTTAEQNLQAVRIARRLGLPFEPDFIMFGPASTRAELRDNALFLKEAGIYGHSPPDPITSEIRLYPATPLRAHFQQRWNAQWDPHTIPEYEFEHAEAKRIHELVGYLETRFIGIIKGLGAFIGEVLYAMISDPRYAERTLPPNQLARLQDLQLAHHMLPTIPYVVFEDIAVHGTITSEEQIPLRINDLLGRDVVEYLEHVWGECRYFEGFYDLAS